MNQYLRALLMKNVFNKRNIVICILVLLSIVLSMEVYKFVKLNRINWEDIRTNGSLVGQKHEIFEMIENVDKILDEQ